MVERYETPQIKLTPFNDKNRVRVEKLQKQIRKNQQEIADIVAETLGYPKGELIRTFEPTSNSQSSSARVRVVYWSCVETKYGCGCYNSDGQCTPCASFPETGG